MSNEYMTITTNDGEVKCRIIFTFFSEEFNHNYVVFEYGDTKELSAMIFTEKDGNSGNLMPIEDDSEWEMVEDAVNDYFNKHHHHHEGCHCEDCESGCGCGGDSACGGHCDCDHDCDCDKHE